MMRVAIAGAGILGHVLAWQLFQQGHELTIYEADAKGVNSGAAWTAAGMLTPNTELEAPDDVLEMGLRSLKRWPSLVESLQGLATFNRGGCWVVAHREDKGSYQHFLNHVQLNNVIDSDKVRHCDRSDLMHGQAALSERFTQALHLPDECWIDPVEVMAAIKTLLLQEGVKWHDNTPVKQCLAHKIITEKSEEEFDWVIDTRGLGARDEWSEVRGIRGEVVVMHAPEVDITALVRLIHPRYTLYIVPRPNHHYVLGATQIESDDNGPMSVRSALELLSAAYSIHPGFAEARITELRTNCRPTLPDHRPAVIVPEKGLIRANGLYRHGILLAPEVSHLVQSELC
ncbi:MAG TPA: glycine oxidase ThiO [Leucothrix mucor]|nr:glycine oxidase ThiO [Leucothrix mucor]